MTDWMKDKAAPLVIPKRRIHNHANCAQYFHSHREELKAEWGEDGVKAQAYVMTIAAIVRSGEAIVNAPVGSQLEADAGLADYNMDSDGPDSDLEVGMSDDDKEDLDTEIVYRKGAGLEKMELSFFLS